ncbi:MAG TPA: Spy/CpxP family protein refolding chaperone [Candidatus Limnocylindrales bacterium]|nr:Spy/CpxP family protein refolding chaperone [Candidatus Limnocylindrales bacterium]
MGVLLVLGAAPMEAQSVEAIMRARERLELTEQQVQQLDAIRREAVAQRSTDMAQIAEVRSQLEAGQIRRSELMAAQEDRQEARQARAEERRASIDAVLTDEQRETVQQMRRRVDRARPGIGRAGVGRQGIGRSGPGFGPRARPGFAPGARRGSRPPGG